METLTLLDFREVGCNRIIDRFKEQDLKFVSFGNFSLNYTLIRILWENYGYDFGGKTYRELVTI